MHSLSYVAVTTAEKSDALVPIQLEHPKAAVDNIHLKNFNRISELA